MGKILDTWLSAATLIRGHGKKRGYFVILEDLLELKSYCNVNPTCSGCPFKEKHNGCMFRGKTPREW